MPYNFATVECKESDLDFYFSFVEHNNNVHIRIKNLGDIGASFDMSSFVSLGAAKHLIKNIRSVVQSRAFIKPAVCEKNRTKISVGLINFCAFGGYFRGEILSFASALDDLIAGIEEAKTEGSE